MQRKFSRRARRAVAIGAAAAIAFAGTWAARRARSSRPGSARVGSRDVRRAALTGIPSQPCAPPPRCSGRRSRLPRSGADRPGRRGPRCHGRRSEHAHSVCRQRGRRHGVGDQRRLVLRREPVGLPPGRSCHLQRGLRWTARWSSTTQPHASMWTDDTVAMVNTRTCNASNFSGCGAAPPSRPLAVSPASLRSMRRRTRSYVPNINQNTVSVIDAATCNATIQAGCAGTGTVTAGNGATQVAINDTDASAYVANCNDGTVSPIDTAPATRPSGPAAPTRSRPSWLARARPRT